MTDLGEQLSEARAHQTPGLITWIATGRRGLSSEAIATHLAGIVVGSGAQKHYPHDPSDLGRCIRLLDAVPSFRPRITEMASVSRTWAALAEHWDELESLYRRESERADHMAPKTYARMRELIQGARS